MDLSIGTLGLGFLAGVLSTLSPCVLPLIPLVVGPALSAHRLGVLALGGGTAASFAAIGILLATAGHSLGLDSGIFRIAAAILMAGFGVLLLSQRLHDRFSMATGGAGDLGRRVLDRLQPDGWTGQLVVGALLGAMWSPCVGPTLGAASLMASQRRDLVEVAATMVLFGLGAALPLVALGHLGRSAMARWRGRLAASGRVGKSLLGVALVAAAAFVGTGADKIAETWLVNAAPEWLTDLTTRY